MVINKKQLINLVISLIIFIMILIMLLGIGLKTTNFTVDKDTLAIALKGFGINEYLSNGVVTYGLGTFNNIGDLTPFLGSVHIIYGSEVTIVFVATLLLACNIIAIFNSNNKNLKLISDVTNKICLFLITILFIVVLVNFNNFAKELGNDKNANLGISVLTLVTFILFTILLSAGLLAYSTILNKDVYKDLNIKFIK